MGNKICPSCGKEIDDNVRFCPWCGTPMPHDIKEESLHNEGTTTQIGDQEESRRHEWPEEEKSVSFTIYEKDPYLDTSINDVELPDEPDTTKGGWSGKHIFFLVVLLLAIVGIVAVFSLHSDKYENHMPDYEKVVEKQNLQQQKREQKLENERREAQRIQDELRRAQEEAAAQEAAQRAAEAAEEEEEDIDEDALEERLQDLFESLGM